MGSTALGPATMIGRTQTSRADPSLSDCKTKIYRTTKWVQPMEIDLKPSDSTGSGEYRTRMTGDVANINQTRLVIPTVVRTQLIRSANCW